MLNLKIPHGTIKCFCPDCENEFEWRDGPGCPTDWSAFISQTEAEAMMLVFLCPWCDDEAEALGESWFKIDKETWRSN